MSLHQHPVKGVVYLNQDIRVASKKATGLREAPGVMTVFTEADIALMGARDLIDILQMIPGFSMALDVQSVVDVGVRGIWGHEGKVLLLFDGHEMNELNFATNNFGNHYPVDQIKRISIIRGPGSAIYGGFAELAVINITTKKAKDYQGITASFRYGQMPKTLGRADLSFQAAKEIGDAKISLSGFLGKGSRSDQIFTDMYGTQFNMAGNNSATNPNMVNFDFQLHDFNVGFLWDHYVTGYQDGYSIAFPYSIGMNFDSYHGSISNDFWLADRRLKITPKLKIGQYKGWNSTSSDAQNVQGLSDDSGNSIYGTSGIYYGRTTTRTRASLVASYDLDDHINFLAGLERYYISSHDPFFSFSTTGNNDFTYNGYSGYGQIQWNNPIINLTLGARYEVNSLFPSAFVPRIVLTKLFDQFHFKLLASQAYRVPAVDNIDTNPSIQPEKATVFELETGYEFSKNLFLSANFFDMTISNPIVYSPAFNNTYGNYPSTGSRGFELEWRYVDSLINSTLSYSYYNTSGKNTVDLYQVPDRNDQVLGLTPHKLTWNNRIRINHKITFNPQLIALGARFAYTYGGVPSDVFQDVSQASQSSQLVSLGPTWLVNAYFRYENLFIENLNAGIGVFNLLNEQYSYAQAYYSPGSAHPPLPATSREVVLDLKYRQAI